MSPLDAVQHYGNPPSTSGRRRIGPCCPVLPEISNHVGSVSSYVHVTRTRTVLRVSTVTLVHYNPKEAWLNATCESRMDD